MDNPLVKSFYYNIEESVDSVLSDDIPAHLWHRVYWWLEKKEFLFHPNIEFVFDTDRPRGGLLLVRWTPENEVEFAVMNRPRTTFDLVDVNFMPV